MRTRSPRGWSSSSSSTAREPPVRVPVTTVPDPLAANDRSIHSRGLSRSAEVGVSASRSSRAERSTSRPTPVGASTSTIGAPSRNVPSSRSATSRWASSTRSSSAIPTLVSATRPWRTSSSSRIRRCSSDCGFQPSVAATTKRQASTPPTPASMFLMNRTWPGTSTSESVAPEGSVVEAKPRSIVRPRAFSSAKRSGSVPVSASTSVDLPWSTWPAVATTCMRGRVVSGRRAGRAPSRARRRRPGGPSVGRAASPGRRRGR